LEPDAGPDTEIGANAGIGLLALGPDAASDAEAAEMAAATTIASPPVAPPRVAPETETGVGAIDAPFAARPVTKPTVETGAKTGVAPLLVEPEARPDRDAIAAPDLVVPDALTDDGEKAIPGPGTIHGAAPRAGARLTLATAPPARGVTTAIVSPSVVLPVPAPAGAEPAGTETAVGRAPLPSRAKTPATRPEASMIRPAASTSGSSFELIDSEGEESTISGAPAPRAACGALTPPVGETAMRGVPTAADGDTAALREPTAGAGKTAAPGEP
jgi:hypothetical protein